MITIFFLADDDPDERDMFEEALHKIDSRIFFQSAANGRELIERLDNSVVKPEIIFLDINMPEVDGWESLKTIKQNERLMKIPVVMYSTSAATIDGQRAIKGGAVCYLEKPGSFGQLKEFLQDVIDSSKDNLKDTLSIIQASKKHNILVS